MEKNDIIIIHGTDYKNMDKRVLEQAGVAADIGDLNKKIALKPNLVTAKAPSSGATTHSELLAGVIEYLREHGFQNITIMEGSWVGDHTEDAFQAAGYHQVCSRYGVPFVDLQRDTWKEYDAADRNHLEKRDAYTAGVQLLKRFDELEQAEQELAACASEEDKIRETEEKIQRISGAYEIQSVFQRYMDAVRTAESTRKNLSEQETAIPALIETGKEAEREAEAAKERLSLEIRNFTQVSERVQKSLEIFSKIRQAKEQASLAQEECRRTEQEAKDAQKKMQALEENERLWRSQAEALSQAEINHERWQAECAKAEEIGKDITAVSYTHLTLPTT